MRRAIPALLDAVGGYLDEGYMRIKLKIEPGWDVEPVAAVREAYPDIPLQVDANTAYTDPFRARKTLNVHCFVHDPITGAQLGVIDLSTTWDRTHPIGLATARVLARLIQKAIHQQTGLTCSIGVTPNKLLSKI